MKWLICAKGNSVILSSRVVNQPCKIDNNLNHKNDSKYQLPRWLVTMILFLLFSAPAVRCRHIQSECSENSKILSAVNKNAFLVHDEVVKCDQNQLEGLLYSRKNMVVWFASTRMVLVPPKARDSNEYTSGRWSFVEKICRVSNHRFLLDCQFPLLSPLGKGNTEMSFGILLVSSIIFFISCISFLWMIKNDSLYCGRWSLKILKTLVSVASSQYIVSTWLSEGLDE